MFKVSENRFGRSVFAEDLIREGTLILTFSGQAMLYEETKALHDQESFALQRGPDFYLFLDEPARYFNHSCEPNCGLRDLDLIALREIAAGEELSYDYSTTMLERDWNLKCNCGKQSCRGVVNDFDRLPLVRQNYYLEKQVVQDFIIERLKK